MKDSISFSAEGDSAIVRTGGDWWILYGFTFYESLDIRSDSVIMTQLKKKKRSRIGE